MRSKSNVSMDMIKVFTTTTRHKDMSLNYHIICMMCAYYYYKRNILNLNKPNPLIDVELYDEIFVTLPDTYKKKIKKFNKIRRDDNEQS